MDGFRRDLKEWGNERGRQILTVQSAVALEMFTSMAMVLQEGPFLKNTGERNSLVKKSS